jgi:hypothetical protein
MRLVTDTGDDDLRARLGWATERLHALDPAAVERARAAARAAGEPGCSFCPKVRAELRSLVVSHDVAVCDECLDLCLEIVGEGLPVGADGARAGEPTPAGRGASCSFCGADRARRFVRGPTRPSGYPVIICDLCVDDCAELMRDGTLAPP